jgi:hypothetical protein
MQPVKPTAPFAFGPRNYRLMWIGLAFLAVGFFTMTLGDKNNYGEDFFGITLGPLLLVLGFGIEFAAILVRDKSLVVAPVTEAMPATAAETTAPTPAAPAYKRL